MFPARNIPSKQRYVHMLYIFNSGYALHVHLRVTFRTFMGGVVGYSGKESQSTKTYEEQEQGGRARHFYPSKEVHVQSGGTCQSFSQSVVVEGGWLVGQSCRIVVKLRHSSLVQSTAQALFHLTSTQKRRVKILTLLSYSASPHMTYNLIYTCKKFLTYSPLTHTQLTNTTLSQTHITHTPTTQATN